MDKANLNAEQSLKQMKTSRISTLESRTNAMNQVAAALSMSEAPLRIECYDISNSADGRYQVASMVVFEDGIAKPSEYRRFSIKGPNGIGQLDDLSALYETISRRFKHKDESNSDVDDDCVENPTQSYSKKFAYKPNLVIVDGGIEQAKAAQKAMIDCNVKGITVCGLSKKLEEVWLPNNQYPIILKEAPKDCICFKELEMNLIALRLLIIGKNVQRQCCIHLLTQFLELANLIKNVCFLHLVVLKI